MPDLPRIQYAVLDVLKENGRTHAYEIKRILRGVVGHSSVYAALSSAQAKGLVQSEWVLPDYSDGTGLPRKYFDLTAQGVRALSEAEATGQGPTQRRAEETA